MRFTDPEFPPLLRGLGIPIGKKLGHGAYGIVFEHLTDRERVIKVHTGPNEARTAQWLMQHTHAGTSPHACLPAVFSAGPLLSDLRLVGYRGRGNLWIYEREALANWRVLNCETLWGYPCTDRPCLDGFYRAWGAVFDAIEISAFRPGQTLRRLIADDYRRFIRWSDGIFKHDPVALQRAMAAFRQVFKESAVDIRRMIDFAEWARDKGIKLTDLHRENWGQRANGEKVVRDLGGIRLPSSP